ncbi:MAG: flagellar hook-associated protein FlgL [Oscillospiraceae bacterium]|nr:flagellar hook-associated protein FlgL [Oscillospiraceae bacterium]
MAMRITNNMMVGNYNRNLSTTTEGMFRLQNQLSTGRKISRISEDPVNIVKALSANARLSDVEQYQRNVSDANAWLTQTETALSQLNDVILRAYELTVQAANDTLEAADRLSVAQEIRQLRDQILTIANTTLGDKFIFGAYNITREPFIAGEDGAFLYTHWDSWVDMVGDYGTDPDDYNEFGNILYEVSVGLDYYRIENDGDFAGAFAVGLNPASAFGLNRDSVYYVLYALGEILASTEEPDPVGVLRDTDDPLWDGDWNPDSANYPSHPDIFPFIERLQTMQKHVLTQMTEVGGRLARLEMLEDRYAQDSINYRQMKSDVEDLDYAEAMMWFTMAESVYRSSLSVGGRILPPTLMDFMR